MRTKLQTKQKPIINFRVDSFLCFLICSLRFLFLVIVLAFQETSKTTLGVFKKSSVIFSAEFLELLAEKILTYIGL